MRVLVVEDEAKLASLLRQGLRREGMGVDVVSTGEEAVTRATATNYDVILLDVMLPGHDGFEVCRRLRAYEVWSPTLMLTALDDVHDRDPRARQRRRRLPRQAVLVRRAAGADASADASRRAAAADAADGRRAPARPGRRAGCGAATTSCR